MARKELKGQRVSVTPDGTSDITYTPTTTGTPNPLFMDNFTSNSKGWSVGSVPGYTRVVKENALTLADTNHGVLVESLPTSTTFNDFSASITFALLQADEHDSVGIYVRGDSNLDHDYRVAIFGNNTYAISKETLNTDNDPEQVPLVQRAQASSLKPYGQQNTLTVTMKGSTMVVQMNGVFVQSLTDTDYKDGQIALFVENGATSSGVTAAFYHVAIYPAPSRLPPLSLFDPLPGFLFRPVRAADETLLVGSTQKADQRSLLASLLLLLQGFWNIC